MSLLPSMQFENFLTEELHPLINLENSNQNIKRILKYINMKAKNKNIFREGNKKFSRICFNFLLKKLCYYYQWHCSLLFNNFLTQCFFRI